MSNPEIRKFLFMIQKTYFKTKSYCKVKFSIQHVHASSMDILGLNSDWDKAIPMIHKKDGTFSVDVNLPKESRHEFKYLMNKKEWINDPDADAEVPNGLGGTNSVITL